MNEIISAAVLLILIMDPLGNLPIFMSVLKHTEPKRRRAIMIRELFIALLVMLIFLFAGEKILAFLNLRAETVSISGGIILFLIAIKMIFPSATGNSIGPYLAGILVQRRSGCDLVSYLTPRLFSKLGIKRPTWETDPLGNSFGAGGLFLTLSELHKFGLFYLNKGKWNGKQILSEKWIEESTKAADVGYYGYLFWRGEYNSFRADGKYSQISMILPKKNAVVSFVSECRRGDELLKTVYELVCAKL